MHELTEIVHEAILYVCANALPVKKVQLNLCANQNPRVHISLLHKFVEFSAFVFPFEGLFWGVWGAK